MKGILGTVGKVAVGLSFGVGVGLAAWLSGVVYGAAGTVAAYRADDGSSDNLEAAIDHHSECITQLGETAQ